MTTVEIDLNVRVRGNQTFSGLEDADGPLRVGQQVEAFEVESGVYGPAWVTEVDEKKRLVYLQVEWGRLEFPDE